VGIGTFILDGLNYNPVHPEYEDSRHDFGVEINYRIIENGGDFIHEGVAASGISGNLLYKYPNKSEEFGMLVRPADQLFENILTSEDELDYQDFTVKIGEPVNFDGKQIKLVGFNKDLDSVKYDLLPGDISIAGKIIIDDGNTAYEVNPVYIIRGSNPMGIKDFSPENQMHVRLSDINPSTETFEIKLAKNNKSSAIVPVEIAQNVPRSDYLILEAKVFPGINMFWLGGILMMLGLILAWFARKVKKVNASV
jgi:hypothetical protein